jgi:hypothetical protein
LQQHMVEGIREGGGGGGAKERKIGEGGIEPVTVLPMGLKFSRSFQKGPEENENVEETAEENYGRIIAG